MEGVDQYKRVAPSQKEIVKEIQALNEPIVMLAGNSKHFYSKAFFSFPRLKNMLDYCTVADMIDRLTQYPFQAPCMSSCTAEAGALKSAFPRCLCNYVSGCDLGSVNQPLSCEAWMSKG